MTEECLLSAMALNLKWMVRAILLTSYRVNPKFCVNHFEVRIEQSLFAAAAGLSSCLLINRITPEGLDVKGDEAFISP